MRYVHTHSGPAVQWSTAWHKDAEVASCICGKVRYAVVLTRADLEA